MLALQPSSGDEISMVLSEPDESRIMASCLKGKRKLLKNPGVWGGICEDRRGKSRVILYRRASERLTVPAAGSSTSPGMAQVFFRFHQWRALRSMSMADDVSSSFLRLAEVGGPMMFKLF